MLNVTIWIIIALLYSITHGIESQPTIEDDSCDDWQLKQDNYELRKSLERMRKQKTNCRCPAIITLVNKLNQSSFSSSNIFGVTEHEERIYVLCYSPNMLRVYEDGNQFGLVDRIPLRLMISPNDMVYDYRSKSFYITDSDRFCIWKVSITNGNQTQVTMWVKDTNWPHTVSLTSDGHLMVTRDSHYSNFNHSQLEIYDRSDARRIHCLLLPTDIIRPRHAIQAKTGGEFLISHRTGKYWNGTWVVSRVSSDGQTILAQSNIRNDSTQLEWPRYLALDPDNDRLFVADFENDRVVVLDPDSLVLLQILLTKQRDGIHQPNRLQYDRKKKQLFVTGGNVEVYKIDYKLD